MPAEIPKGMRLILQMVGITPEMLADPALLLRQMGVNPDDVLKKVAEFQQIGLRIEGAFNRCEARLARIEAHLGIADPGTGRSADAGAGDDMGNVGQLPPNRRN